MTKSVIAFILASCFCTPVMAGDPYAREQSSGSKGIQVYDARNGADVRQGVACDLEIQGGEGNYKGLCNIGYRDGVTLIETGTRTFKIERDPVNKKRGKFYEKGNLMGTVKASGNCWTGEDISFCAN